MMNKQRECEEIVTDVDAGKSYRFAGTFGFIQMLDLAGRNPALIFADLADGLLPPGEIKDVIKFSVEQVDGEDIEDIERESIAVDFIERAGLQDASMLARIMMGHAMVGAIKKKQIRRQETLQGILIKPSRFRWVMFGLLGLSAGGSLAGLIALACMTIRIW